MFDNNSDHIIIFDEKTADILCFNKVQSVKARFGKNADKVIDMREIELQTFVDYLNSIPDAGKEWK